MSFNTPEQITAAAVETGAKRAFLTPDKMLVGGFLAGAYIAFGGLLSMAVSSGLDPKTWGTLPTLFSGAVFSVGLMLCILAGPSCSPATWRRCRSPPCAGGSRSGASGSASCSS